MADTFLTTYLDSSSPVINMVFWASCVLLGVIAGLVLAMLVSRAIHLRHAQQRRHIASCWLPVFNATRDKLPCDLPVVHTKARPLLLELWLDYRKLVTGEAGARLDRLARQAGLETTILDILKPPLFGNAQRPAWQRRVALSAAEWLYSEKLLRYLHAAAESDNLYLAVRACFCLTRLRAPDYEQKVISLLFRFPDQSAYLATELGQAGSTEILQLLEPFIDDMPAGMATNFVALADKSNDRSILPLLIRRLGRSRDGREIAILVRTLGRLGDSTHSNLVSQYLHHERYYVRIQAMTALGRIGRPGDVRLLTPFLYDSEWWVRYRAARAIIRLLGRDPDAVERLRSRLDDDFARDILHHALTELNWCLS